MTTLRWKFVTILLVFVVFFGVGVYPILATRYGWIAALDVSALFMISIAGLWLVVHSGRRID